MCPLCVYTRQSIYYRLSVLTKVSARGVIPTVPSCDHCVRSDVELVDMDLVLLADGWCLARRVGGDGNCLFASVAHQLFGYAIGLEALMRMTAALRVMVVEHLGDNIGSVEYLLAVRLRVEEELPWLLGNDDEGTMRNFLPVLARSGVWGIVLLPS